MSSNKIQKSLGWSLFSEIAVKFVVPITNMILARVLTPDAFGVVAVCNMLISFVDLITDAGFGKYIVQHDFENDKDKENYINVSFWTNLGNRKHCIQKEITENSSFLSQFQNILKWQP